MLNLINLLIHFFNLFFNLRFSLRKFGFLSIVFIWIGLFQISIGETFFVLLIFFFDEFKFFLSWFDHGFLARNIFSNFFFILLSWNERSHWSIIRLCWWIRESYLPLEFLLLRKHVFDLTKFVLKLLHLMWVCWSLVGSHVIILIIFSLVSWLILLFRWWIFKQVLVFSLCLTNLHILSCNLIS